MAIYTDAEKMPADPGAPLCLKVTPSAPSELGWVLNLLVQSAPYAEPAISELDSTLLPGVARLRAPVRRRFQELWEDDVAGCPELLPAAHIAGCLLETDQNRFLGWLARGTNQPPPPYALLAEPVAARPAILRRLERICTQGALRARYGELLASVWDEARGPWEREGRAIAIAASTSWLKRIERGGRIEDLVAPRHPLTRAEQLGFDDLFNHRSGFVLSPLYFCLSGGHVADLGEYVHIAVAASDLLPVRKARDAMFVADRLRVLAERTRVHILIQLLSSPSGVMEVARALRLSQPTVSGHLKALRDAGLVHQRKLGSRTVFVASRKRIERHIEDARATLARWD
jgi:DNA-binding transcriptional ArsR family regulator